MRLYRETSRAPSVLSIMTIFPASTTAEGAQFNGTPFPRHFARDDMLYW